MEELGWILLQLIVCFCVLVFASWCVGEGGDILGKKYDASIIGGLVIAWLNTTPETIFFITALHSGNPRFAIGAVSGSSIVVCTVALGACLWIGANARKNGFIHLQHSVKRQCSILGASLIIPLLISIFGFNLMIGVAGIVFYGWFLYFSLTHKEDPVHHQHDAKKEGDIEQGEAEEEEEDEPDQPTSKGIAYLVVGGLLIMAFSSPFISSVVDIARTMKVNPVLLAFFLAPIASEAPEILESVSLSRKGHMGSINVAYSNLIGGTLSKTTLLCGILCFYGVYKDFAWESPSYSISLLMLLFCAGVAAGIGSLFTQQSKWHGMILASCWVITAVLQYNVNINFEEHELQ